jgi:16S rRNA G966 N2-methylase RsmD
MGFFSSIPFVGGALDSIVGSGDKSAKSNGGKSQTPITDNATQFAALAANLNALDAKLQTQAFQQEQLTQSEAQSTRTELVVVGGAVGFMLLLLAFTRR